MTRQISSTSGQGDASGAWSGLPGRGLLLVFAMIAALLLTSCALDSQPARFTPPGKAAAAPVVAQAGSPQALSVSTAGPESPPTEPVIKGSPSRWITDTVHPVEYRGLVQVLPSTTMTGTVTGTWTIGGHLVNVSPETDLKLQLGALEAGAYVQVIGRLQPDGSIDAVKILVKKLNPGRGNLQPPGKGITNTVPPTNTLAMAQPDDDEPEDQDDGNRNWDIRLHGPVAGAAITNTAGVTYTLIVNGQQVVVDEDTWLKARRDPADGDWLQVKGLLQSDGTILATSIQWVHRVPDQARGSGGGSDGKSVDKQEENGGAPAIMTPAPGTGGAAGPGKSGTEPGGVKALPPGKSGGQVGPAQGTGGGSGHQAGGGQPGKGNGNANGHK